MAKIATIPRSTANLPVVRGVVITGGLLFGGLMPRPRDLHCCDSETPVQSKKQKGRYDQDWN